MCESWQRHQPDLLGRFDLLVSPGNAPKLLEYNADTPTLLLEASVVQADWARHHGAKQFNEVDELLIASWPKCLQRTARAWERSAGSLEPVLFSAHRTSIEEADNIDYLASTARRAGLRTMSCDIDHVHVSSQGSVGVTTLSSPGSALAAPQAVHSMWKLYPYEWLVEEELGAALDHHVFTRNALDASGGGCVWMEPPWKLILSNKALLPLLWEMFPNHPNLLPAFFTAEEASAHEALMRHKTDYWGEYGWVAKPKFGREGVGILYSFDFPDMDAFDRQVCKALFTYALCVCVCVCVCVWEGGRGQGRPCTCCWLCILLLPMAALSLMPTNHKSQG